MSDYESNKLLGEYLLMHYGVDEQRMPWGLGRIGSIDFPRVTASYFTNKRVALTLDLGCAVGASSFHLSKTSQKVIGIDFSEQFINAANTLREQGEIAYSFQEEGDQYIDAIAQLPEQCEPEKVSFAVGDAMDLPVGFKGFDRVHASNLLCRLPDPNKLLDRLPSLLKEDGELVLATPFSWLEEFTPKENWPKADSWQWLQDKLADDFELVKHADEIFTIREHVRKFQLGVSKVSHWKRR